MSTNSGGLGGGDSLDALKYSAPKDPKKAKKQVSVAAPEDDFKMPSRPAPTATAPAAASPAPVAPTAGSAKTPGASKILASSPVRLYRVNPSTRAYEPVDNGSVLGCVVMGTGINYQLLVYNAQVSVSLVMFRVH